MTYKGHLAVGLTSTIPLTLYYDYISISGVLIALIASLLPDLDHPQAYISRIFPFNFLSMIISPFTTHRGFTHTLKAFFVFSLIVYGIIYFVHYSKFNMPINLYIYGIYASVGYLSHLIADGFTVSGIRGFWKPISKKTFYVIPSFLRFKTGDIGEYIWIAIFLGIYFAFFILNQPIIKL